MLAGVRLRGGQERLSGLYERGDLEAERRIYGWWTDSKL